MSPFQGYRLFPFRSRRRKYVANMTRELSWSDHRPPVKAPRKRKPMTIHMQTQSGRSILLTVELSETIDDIRYKVYVKEGINVDQQRIFHNGILCRDGILVRDMFLRNNDKLFLVIRGRGG